MEKDSWEDVNSNIFSAPILKNMDLLFNNYFNQFAMNKLLSISLIRAMYL